MVSTDFIKPMIAMQNSTDQLRLMTTRDLQAAVELSSSAGWNQTIEDWSMLLDLAPDGCFAIEAHGQLVSTITLLCYGQRLAWIGMVLTKPEYQGRGYARRLLAHALDCADSLAIETVKLDATDRGRQIYENFGFHAEQPVERWSRPGVARPDFFGNSFPVSEYARDLDLHAFGVDRSVMIERLAERSEVYTDSDAFLLNRKGCTTAYLGPCVSSDPTAGRALIRESIDASSRSSWFWDLLPSNRDAITLAPELGFTCQRLLTRMARGKPLHQRADMIYAIAGFELG
jgi:GNAT superfamily N-acetyltransferase